MENDLPNIKKKLKEMIQKINLIKQTTILKNSTFEPILETLYSNEKGCDLFMAEVLEQKVQPSQFIKIISEYPDNVEINKVIRLINNKINNLDEKFIHSKTFKDIQLFLNYLNSIKRHLNKLKFIIFNSLYTNVQNGGGGLEDSERDLDEVIILNKNIVEKLETIASLCEQITQKLLTESSSFDCVSLSTKMNRDIENFLHYKTLFKTVSDMIADPTHASVLSDVIKESWFIQISEIIKNRNWEPIDLKDENIQNWKSERCKDILAMSTEYTNLLKIVPKLVNLYEDMKGAVRILVRFNNVKNEQINLNQYITIDYQNKTLLTKRNKINVRGVYSIYDNLTNQQMYLEPPHNQESLKGTFDQLRDGYSNFIFGYGYSGSGKTYTLYGKNQDVGIIQYGLNDLINDNYKVELVYAFDIYGFMKYTTATGLQVESSIIQYIKPDAEFNKNVDSNITINSKIIDPTRIDKTNLYGVFDKLNEFRKENKSIKETINNPESSRGHLFLTFEITKNDKKSYLTVIDMAGIEDPLAIISFYFEPISSNNGNSVSNILACVGNDDIKGKGKLLEWKKKISKAHPKGLEYTDAEKKNVYQIIREGFFINETIHHLKAFLLEKQGIVYNGKLQQGHSITGNKIMFLPDKYSKENIFFQPNTSSSKSILIYNVLKYLSIMTKTKKQSKFIMMSVIRSDRVDPETKDIKFIDETLNYVNNLLNH
jgi:hypothetical protein